MFGRRGCCRCHSKRTEKDCEDERDLSHREQYLKSSTLTSTDHTAAGGHLYLRQEMSMASDDHKDEEK
jgi:hypothetical protein